jgi:hypothetical protein
MKFSEFLFSYQIISHVTPAETNVFVASGFHVVLLFTPAPDEHNAVRHTHSLNYVLRII